MMRSISMSSHPTFLSESHRRRIGAEPRPLRVDVCVSTEGWTLGEQGFCMFQTMPLAGTSKSDMHDAC